MKKALSILVAAVMLFATFAVGISAEKSSPALRFNEDGKFRIMQVADLQDNAVLNPVAKDFLKAAIENEKPDLIVLTGDNFAGYSTGTNICHTIDKSLAKKAINEYMSIFEKYGIPVTMVPGNHDDDDIKLTKEEELAMYEKYDCFIGYDADPEMYGCGTHNIPIYSSKNAYKLAYNLWMFDSNTYDEELGGYDYVHDDQVEWYVNKSNELKAANDGKTVPSMVFQHIIVKEIYDILEEFNVSFFLGDNTLPVPLVDENRMNVVTVVVTADCVHVGVKSLVNAVAVSLESRSLPLCERLNDFRSTLDFFSVEFDLSLNTVEVVIDAAAFPDNERCADTFKVECGGKLICECILNKLDCLLCLSECEGGGVSVHYL